MRVHILGVELDPSEALDLVPQCGKDFCDECSDCLSCFEGDSCQPSEGEHAWIVYPDQVDDFRERMGLGERP